MNQKTHNTTDSILNDDFNEQDMVHVGSASASPVSPKSKAYGGGGQLSQNRGSVGVNVAWSSPPSQSGGSSKHLVGNRQYDASAVAGKRSPGGASSSELYENNFYFIQNGADLTAQWSPLSKRGAGASSSPSASRSPQGKQSPPKKLQPTPSPEKLAGAAANVIETVPAKTKSSVAAPSASFSSAAWPKTAAWKPTPLVTTSSSSSTAKPPFAVSSSHNISLVSTAAPSTSMVERVGPIFGTGSLNRSSAEGTVFVLLIAC